MTLTFRNRLHRYGAVILTIITVFYLVTGSARGWLSYVYAGDPPPRGLEDAIAIEGSNSDFHFLLGQFYDNYDYTVPRSEAYSYYKEALKLNPLNYNYWFYLAEYLSRLGEKDKALFALKQATELSPGVVSLRWGAGMLASKLGDEEALISNLRSVITHDRNRRYKAFSVLWQSLRNEEKIRRAIPDIALPAYLHFLISTKRIIEAKIIWEQLSNHSETPKDLFLRYVTFLINENEIFDAKVSWANQFGDWNGIWNGDFENETLNGGFDWRIRNVEGVNTSLDTNINDGNRSIKIEFDGKHNVDFYHFHQIVPVEKNTKYKLSSVVKSNNLSSRNGLFWEVYCPNSNKLYARTDDQMLGTTDWHQIMASFKTPPDCDYLVIRLRRFKDTEHNRKISGTVWIDKVVLEKSID